MTLEPNQLFMGSGVSEELDQYGNPADTVYGLAGYPTTCNIVIDKVESQDIERSGNQVSLADSATYAPITSSLTVSLSGRGVEGKHLHTAIKGLSGVAKTMDFGDWEVFMTSGAGPNPFQKHGVLELTLHKRDADQRAIQWLVQWLVMDDSVAFMGARQTLHGVPGAPCSYADRKQIQFMAVIYRDGTKGIRQLKAELRRRGLLVVVVDRYHHNYQNGEQIFSLTASDWKSLLGQGTRNFTRPEPANWKFFKEGAA